MYPKLSSMFHILSIFLIFRQINDVLRYFNVLNMTIGERIKELRNKKKLTQSDLAKQIGLSYIQIGRYEKHKSHPSSEVLQKLADALDTTTDYLMNGDSEEIASGKITDRDLIDLFKAVEELNRSDQELVKTFLDALITKRKIQTLAS